MQVSGRVLARVLMRASHYAEGLHAQRRSRPVRVQERSAMHDACSADACTEPARVCDLDTAQSGLAIWKPSCAAT